jgi:acetyl esterase
MQFDLVSRTRVAISRKLVRAIYASPSLYRRLKARHAVPGLDPDLAVMLSLDDITGDTHIWKCTPATARRKMAESVAVVEDTDPSEDVQRSPLEIPATTETPALPARLYAARGGSAPSPGLVYLHGGGWVIGDLDTHDQLCCRLARLGGLRVVAIDYRLAPEHRFPAAVLDSLAAFRYVAAHAESLGIDPARLGVAGDSAGGNLSAVVGLHTRGDARRPALSVLLYPALDAGRTTPSHRELAEGFFLNTAAMDWYYDHYRGPRPQEPLHPDASPLHAADVAGSPPTLIVAAAFDPLRDEAAAYAERLRAAGVTTVYKCYPDLIHGFALLTGLSASARHATATLASTIGQALRQGLAATAPPPG